MFCGSECDFFCLISKQLHVLLNLNRRFAGACDLSGERPRNWFGRVVSQVAVDSQQSWIRRGSGRSVATYGFRMVTAPVLLRNTRFHIPAFLSGTNEMSTCFSASW